MIARRMGPLMVAMLLGLPGCRTKEAPPPATPPDEPEATGTIDALTFAWPRPARARVVERIFWKERHAVTEYFVVLEDEPDGRISVRYADFHFLEVEGLDIEDPKVAHQLEQLEFQTALVLPPMYVNRDGSWSQPVGVGGALPAGRVRRCGCGPASRGSGVARCALRRSGARQSCPSPRPPPRSVAWLVTFGMDRLSPRVDDVLDTSGIEI